MRKIGNFPYAIPNALYSAMSTVYPYQSSITQIENNIVILQALLGLV